MDTSFSTQEQMPHDSPLPVVFFAHNHTDGSSHVFEIKSSYMVHGSQATNNPILLSIIDDNGKEQGSIIGTLDLGKAGEKGFFVLQSSNVGTKTNEQLRVKIKSPYKGLIREAIATLIEQNIIDTWHSDINLSDGAVKMYNNLLEMHSTHISLIDDPRWPYVLHERRE